MSTATLSSAKRSAESISDSNSIAKKSRKQEPVAIIMNDENGNPLDDSIQESSTQSLPPAANFEARSTPTNQQQQREIKHVQKIDWRYLAKKDKDGRTNFERLVTVTNLNPKNDACYVNFNKRQYENETHERFSNKATRNALTIEGPWMKVVYGLKDSNDYPGSFSMTLSCDNMDADEDVADFVNFMDNVVDGTLKREIISRGYDWMKDEDKYKGHLIVKQNQNTKDTVYKTSWAQGTYTQEAYEGDVEQCIQGALRPISKDGGPLGFHVKVYPIKEGKSLVLTKDGLAQPDVMIVQNTQPPKQVSYFDTALGQRKGEGEMVEMFVKPVFSIARLSFAKERFHITPVCRLMCYQTADDIEGEVGGTQEMEFKFDGQTTPATLTIHQSTPTA